MRMISKVISLAVLSALVAFPLAAQNAAVGGMTASAPTEARADAAFMAKDFKNAAELYADYLEDQPLDGKAWFRLGFAQNFLGSYAKSSSSFEKAYTAGFMPVISMYNVACGYARSNDKAKALFWLQKIADSGYRNVSQVTEDADFDNVRNEPKFKQIMAQIKNNAAPCEQAAEHHQFDFWVGEWKVAAPGGQEAGVSRVERAVDQCAIVESWTGSMGGNGRGVNVYNPDLKKWQQFWVDSSGVSMLYTGQRVGNEMRFAGEGWKEGKAYLRKQTFYDVDPYHVRLVGETSADGGKTWKVEYDLTYVRK